MAESIATDTKATILNLAERVAAALTKRPSTNLESTQKMNGDSAPS